MQSSGAAFVISMAVACVVTPLIRRFALRRGLVDRLDARKVHRGAIPRLGGIAIVVAFYVAVAAILLHQTALARQLLNDRSGLIGFLFGGAAIALLGLFDDLRNANAVTKLAVQVGVAAALYALGFRITRVATPWGIVLELGWLSFAVTTLWIVGVVNAMNLIDGLDGLAGGIALISLTAVFSIAAMRGAPFMMLSSAALGGAVLGFLFYNFNPATIFMGDTGSLFLGFMLSTSAIRASQKSSTAVAVFVPLVLLLVPLVDTIFALVRRGVRRQRLLTGDREHIHHRLIGRGLSQRQAVGVLCAISATASAGAVLWYVGDRNIPLAVLLSVAAIAVCVVAYRAPASRLGSAEPSIPFVHAVEKSTSLIVAAFDHEEMWVAVREFAQSTGAWSATVELHWRDGEQKFERRYHWQPVPVGEVGLTKHRDSSSYDALEAHIDVTWPSESAERAQVRAALSSLAHSFARRAAALVPREGAREDASTTPSGRWRGRSSVRG